jgi:hypothetical protein
LELRISAHKPRSSEKQSLALFICQVENGGNLDKIFLLRDIVNSDEPGVS